MFNALLAGIVLVAYAGYLFLGINQGFPIFWLDWHPPYMHYEVNREVSADVFILPIVLGLMVAMNWYRSSMRGEA